METVSTLWLIFWDYIQLDTLKLVHAEIYSTLFLCGSSCESSLVFQYKLILFYQSTYMKSLLVIALQDFERIGVNSSPCIVRTSLNTCWITLIYMSNNISPWSSTHGSACTINDSCSWCYKDSQIIAPQTSKSFIMNILRTSYPFLYIQHFSLHVK